MLSSNTQTIKDLLTATISDDEEFLESGEETEENPEDMPLPAPPSPVLEEEPVTKTPKKRTPRSKTTDKLSVSDRKNLAVLISSEMQQLKSTIDTLIQQNTEALEAMVMSSIKPVPPKASKKSGPSKPVTFPVSTIHSPFMSMYMSTYKKSTITAKEMTSVMTTWAFNDEHLTRNKDHYKALNLNTTEIKILSGLESDSHLLNISKSDVKTILNKLVTLPTTFTFNGNTYDIKSKNLWETMLGNGCFLKGVKISPDTSSYLMPVALGDALRDAFGKRPTTAGKSVTSKTFGDYIAMILNKPIDVYYAVAAANVPVLTHFGVPFSTHKGIPYTKASLLKAALTARLNEEKTFNPEDLDVLETYFPGTNFEKIRVDEIVTRCSYSANTE